MKLLHLSHVLAGKPNRTGIFIRFTILIVALSASGPVVVRWWRALLAVL